MRECARAGCSQPRQARDYCAGCKRNYNLQTRYGLTSDDVAGLIEAQGNACVICLRRFGDVRAVVDHDHSTGAIRGILCPSCNRGIGLFLDNGEALGRAALYCGVGPTKAA